MTELDLLIAKAQRNLSAATVVILVIVLGLLFVPPLFGAPPIDPTVEKLLFVILGGVLGNYAAQNQFWFGRPRQAGIPDAPQSVGPVRNVETMNVTAPAPANPPETP